MTTLIGVVLVVIGWLMAIGAGIQHEASDKFSALIGMIVSMVLIVSGIYLIAQP